MQQKFVSLLALASVAFALPQTMDVTATESSMPTEAVSDILSGFYGTNIPAQATGAAATSLASALYSVETSLVADPAYMTAANEVYDAIAAQPTSAQNSILSELGDISNADFTTAEWYKTGVPTSAQSAIEGYWSVFAAVETSVLGSASATATPTASGSGSASGTTAGTTGTSATTTGTSASESGSVESTSTETGAAAPARATGQAIAGLAVAMVAIAAL
ncbi:hypothetical protein F5Y15DRAFT_375368 [Xylariaceae sp. FL0016]|nr:hypothetical protein F5Y15DRAFT_375368 [Xylariaceae sp. FL0016]